MYHRLAVSLVMRVSSICLSIPAHINATIVDSVSAASSKGWRVSWAGGIPRACRVMRDMLYEELLVIETLQRGAYALVE